MRSLHFVFAAVLLALAPGCASPLESITDVIKPRVIGVMFQVQGDATRSTPTPGETVDVELIVADPGPRKGRTWVFVACTPAESSLDIASCETLIGGPYFSPALPGEADPKPAPRFSISVPDEATLGETTDLLVIGGVCADGDIDLAFDPSAYQGEATTANPCVDQEKQGQLIAMRIPLERVAEDRNRSPEFATVAFDGVPWDAVAGESDPVGGCAGGPLPQLVHDLTPIGIDMTLTDGSRESFVNDDDPPETEVEEPYVAFQATRGDFEGAYSFFDDTPNAPTLTWTMPPLADLTEDGLLVRFWFVLRDERGGSTYAERAICILQPPPSP